MEKDPNIMEGVTLTLFDIAKAAGQWTLELLKPLVSDESDENTGGGPMLDRELYEKVDVDPAQGTLF